MDIPQEDGVSDILRRNVSGSHEREEPQNGDILETRPISNSSSSIGEDRTAIEAKILHRNVQNSKSCPICMKKFGRLYNMKVHVRKHSGETPYECPYANCDIKFKWRSSLGHHVRSFHSGTKEDIPSRRSKKMDATRPASSNAIKFQEPLNSILSKASNSAQTLPQTASKSKAGKKKNVSTLLSKGTKRKNPTRGNIVMSNSKKRKGVFSVEYNVDHVTASVENEKHKVKALPREYGANAQQRLLGISNVLYSSGNALDCLFENVDRNERFEPFMQRRRQGDQGNRGGGNSKMVCSDGNTLDHFFENVYYVESFPTETLTIELLGGERNNQVDDINLLNIVLDKLTREDALHGVERFHGAGSLEEFEEPLLEYGLYSDMNTL